MKIITTKADDEIMRKFREINGEYCIVDLDDAHDIIDMYHRILDVMGDDEMMVYCHPVYVIHDEGYMERMLGQYDYVTVQQQGQPYMDMSMIAATRIGLETIIAQYNTGVMAVDHSQSPEGIHHNLTLNALGPRARVIMDDGTMVKLLTDDLRGRGIIATHCGTPPIIDWTRRAKLNITDVVTMIMAIKGGNNE